MADEEALHDKISGLSDLELAFLLCLVNRQHCVVTTSADALDDLIEELHLVSTKTFGLKAVSVQCNPNTTLEDFAAAILLPPFPTSPGLSHASPNPTSPRSPSPLHVRGTVAVTADSYFPSITALSPLTPTTPPTPHATGWTVSGVPPVGGGAAVGGGGHQVAPVILARDLSRAPKAVQVQALELLRTRRIFTRTAVQTAPKPFLFVAVLGEGDEKHDDAKGQADAETEREMLMSHLNDHFFISHWHDAAEEGFANMDEQWRAQAVADAGDAETASTESVLRKSTAGDVQGLFTEDDIDHLAHLSQHVQVDADVLRYQMNIVAHLRMHRAVAGGIDPTATKHFDRLMRSLAPLNEIDYVTPALVGLAARKVYPHRIRIASPEKERSMQWGSELGAVREMLAGVDPEEVIEDVLAMVVAPP